MGLGDLPGGSFESSALDVSADGSVIVGYGTSANGQEAFRWTAQTGMISLGLGRATAVSGDGSAVVGTNTDAFYWTPSLGMVNLRAFLVSHGVDLTGWFFLAPTAISDDGLAITGFGPRVTGVENWVVTIPEPATFVLAGLAAGMSFLARVIRRGRAQSAVVRD
jgi:probable HAF family extracellular repeat protein